MLILVFFLICIGVIYVISRYNKSPNLFIKLLLMLLLGFAAGIGYTAIKSSNSKKELTKISVPTQMGMSYTTIALLPETIIVSQLDSESLDYSSNYVNYCSTEVNNQESHAKCRDPIIPFNTS